MADDQRIRPRRLQPRPEVGGVAAASHPHQAARRRRLRVMGQETGHIRMLVPLMHRRLDQRDRPLAAEFREFQQGQAHRQKVMVPGVVQLRHPGDITDHRRGKLPPVPAQRHRRLRRGDRRQYHAHDPSRPENLLEALVRHPRVTRPKLLQDKAHLPRPLPRAREDQFQKRILPCLRSAGVHPHERQPLLVGTRLRPADVRHETGDPRIRPVTELACRRRHEFPRLHRNLGMLAERIGNRRQRKPGTRRDVLQRHDFGRMLQHGERFHHSAT